MVADRYGQGPPVVLLHGQPGSARDWHAVAPLLSDDFSVIVPDRLGYGRTGGDAAGFEQNAVALAHLLYDLSYEQVVVAGYSWGGGHGYSGHHYSSHGSAHFSSHSSGGSHGSHHH